MVLRFKQPPYQLVGSKWQWASVFEDFKEEFESYDYIYDMFGGACWITYWLQENTHHPQLICNDYDSYLYTISSPYMIKQMNDALDACLSAYESCPFTDEELAAWKAPERRLFPPIGRKRDGTWRHEEQFREIKQIISSLSTRAAKSLVWSRFWCAGAPAPNSLNYPKPSKCKPFVQIEGYVDEDRVRVCNGDARKLPYTPSGLGARTLIIADPPFSAVQRASQYYDGDMTADCTTGSPSKELYNLWHSDADLIIFSDMELLSELPEPTQLWIRETENKPFGSAKYHHPVANRLQGAYIYQHKE